MKQVELKTVEEVCERLIDYRGKTPPKTSSGVRLVTAKVIKQGRIQPEPAEYIAEDFYDEWMRRGLPQDLDLLLTTEAPLGEVALLRLREPVALAQRVILLRPNPSIVDPRYLFQAMKGDFVQAELRARASGTTVSGIKQSELRKVRIPVPPLVTQRRIAAILSAYDDLIENCVERIRLLDEMARAIYREWFVEFRFPGHGAGGRVGEARTPNGWTRRAASEVLAINPAVDLPRTGARPFVPMTSLSESTLVISDVETRDKTSGAKFQNGDTLFARITPCLENGKTGFVQFLGSGESGACGSTEFIVLRGRMVPPEFVYCLARSDEFRAHAIKSMSGATGRQRVQEACFDAFSVVIPPKPLLDRFVAFARPAFELAQLLHERSVKLQHARDLLLPRLLSGQLAVAEEAA